MKHFIQREIVKSILSLTCIQNIYTNLYHDFSSYTRDLLGVLCCLSMKCTTSFNCTHHILFILGDFMLKPYLFSWLWLQYCGLSCDICCHSYESRYHVKALPGVCATGFCQALASHILSKFSLKYLQKVGKIIQF